MSAVAKAQIAIAEPVVIDAIGGALSPEFLLIAACCRWPASVARSAAVRAAAGRITDCDWEAFFLCVAKRHRVTVRVADALRSAGIGLPAVAVRELTARLERTKLGMLRLAAETIRLQNLLNTSGIPVIILKGAVLEQLAYGSLATKQTRDIDLLVPPECADLALRVLEGNGYALALPAKTLNAVQRRALIRYGREIELVDARNNLKVELQWRVVDNPLLLKGVDAHAATQRVILAEGVVLRTLAPDDLFAYLCVHGACHSWSRLKWLADLNALLVSTDADIEHVYRYAERIGAGPCAAQALLLCERLLGLTLPAALAEELATDKRHQKLFAIAMQAMRAPNIADPGIRGVICEVRNQFLLGRGFRFYLTQCCLALVGVADIVRLPLPRPLHFIYPLVRLPLWLWRRGKLALAPP